MSTSNLKIFRYLLVVFFASLTVSVQANVSLPAIFGDHMVLQQNAEAAIWGWAKPGEKVTIVCSWDGKEIEAKPDNRARWSAVLSTPAAGGPYSIAIKGYNAIELNDVMIGEVWFCSGQSNMEWTPRAGIDNAEEEIKNANYPNIRLFTVEHRTADSPQLDIRGEWKVCSPETMIDFGAIAYFFGRDLNGALNVPVGLINSSWGGTPAEVWTTAETILNDEGFTKAATKMNLTPWWPIGPGQAFNAMTAPIIPFRIAGALWYQGEANVVDPQNYERLLPALIQNWRNEWGYDFPFYYVQIAPFKYGKKYEGALLRDAQRKAMKTPNTGMVVVDDIGNINDIHPRNKQDVGKRLANWALNRNYGKTSLPVSGPLYKEMKVEKNRVRIFFDYAESGLITKGKVPTHFEIAGEDGIFIPATAKIDGSTVVVQGKGIKNPVAVRFAWDNIAEHNLFNKEGLPASTFRTDDWDIVLE